MKYDKPYMLLMESEDDIITTSNPELFDKEFESDEDSSDYGNMFQ